MTSLGEINIKVKTPAEALTVGFWITVGIICGLLGAVFLVILALLAALGIGILVAILLVVGSIALIIAILLAPFRWIVRPRTN